MRELKFRAWNNTFENFYFSSEIGILGFFELIGNWKDFEPVEQNAGIKDKNGVDIYDGDILGSMIGRKEIIGVMTWDDKLNGWTRFLPENSWEVIGNIHQNKDLLTRAE